MIHNIANKTELFNVKLILRDKKGLVWGHGGYFSNNLYCIVFYKTPLLPSHSFSKNPISISDKLKCKNKKEFSNTINRFKDVFTIEEALKPFQIIMAIAM